LLFSHSTYYCAAYVSVKSEKSEALASAKAAAAPVATKGGKKKKFLNQGTKGGDDGLSDYKYSNYSVDDEYDFM
jgi:translation initiation factor 3 subunit J